MKKVAFALSLAALLTSSRAFAQHPYYDGRYDGCPPVSEDGGFCRTMRDANRIIDENNEFLDDLNKQAASCDHAADLCNHGNGDRRACAYVQSACIGTFIKFRNYRIK